MFFTDCYHGLGAESGAIPDGRLFSYASPTYSSFAYQGRLNNVFPHCARRLNDRSFFVDLVELHWIVAVAVQGYMEGGLQGRVSSLHLRTKLDLAESEITKLDSISTVCLDFWKAKIMFHPGVLSLTITC